MGKIVMEKENAAISMMEEDEAEYSEYESSSSSEEDSEELSEEETDEKEVVESDVEIICDRVEVDDGLKYVLEDGLTVTIPEVVTKFYLKRKRCFPLEHILNKYDFPLSTFAKFALDRYNHIEGSKYEYVGLVKAYSRALAGFRI